MLAARAIIVVPLVMVVWLRGVWSTPRDQGSKFDSRRLGCIPTFPSCASGADCDFGFSCNGGQCCHSTDRTTAPCLNIFNELVVGHGGPLPPGIYVPQCDSQGLCTPLQCHTSTGFCWCALPGCTEIDGTTINARNPDVYVAVRQLCSLLVDQLASKQSGTKTTDKRVNDAAHASHRSSGSLIDMAKKFSGAANGAQPSSARSVGDKKATKGKPTVTDPWDDNIFEVHG